MPSTQWFKLINSSLNVAAGTVLVNDVFGVASATNYAFINAIYLTITGTGPLIGAGIYLYKNGIIGYYVANVLAGDTAIIAISNINWRIERDVLTEIINNANVTGVIQGQIFFSIGD